jgi:hypothetical protein
MSAICPDCKTPPTDHQEWLCFCGERFNHFVNIGKCSHCGYIHEFTECLQPDCKSITLHLNWYPPVTENVKNLKTDLNLISYLEKAPLSKNPIRKLDVE